MIVLPTVVFAQTAAGKTSTASNSTSQNAGNAQNITYNSPEVSTIKSTGSASLPAFAGSFSSDYCGGTAGVAAGGIGFAFTAGSPKIDNSCVMLRVFERTQQAAASVEPTDPVGSVLLRIASLEILAETDAKVKEIFQKRGVIPRD